jgi:adenylate cyclase
MVQDRPVRVERRLLAILVADVAGYSRLMHNDEEATHAKLTALLTDAVAPSIADHGRPHRIKSTRYGFFCFLTRRGPAREPASSPSVGGS